MKPRTLFSVIIVIVISLTIFYTYENTDRKYGEKYRNQILEERENSQAFYKGSDSPLPEDERASFQGLDFYPIDTTYIVEATIERFEKPERFNMATSSGKTKPYLRYATATFTLKGQQHQLLLLKAAPQMGMVDSQDNRLFLAITDKTSGEETYGGGRYLEVYYNGQETVELDFNKLYHPYCAFTTGYNCPIPLRENRMPIAIEAGERLEN